MDDPEILSHIKGLVMEEHDLRERPGRGELAAEAEHTMSISLSEGKHWLRDSVIPSVTSLTSAAPSTIDPLPVSRHVGVGVTVVGVLMALWCVGFAGVSIIFESTDHFAEGPYAQYASGISVMNWLVVGLKGLGAAVALLSVAKRPRFVPRPVVAVLVWGAFATMAVYSLGSVAQAVGMVSGLAGSIDQIDIAGVGYVLFFLLAAAGYGVLAISYSRRHRLRKRLAVFGVFGAPAVLGLILLAWVLLAALGLLPTP
jgi:hypothetical protein